MYYSSGNYEAFARPQKPQGVDEKAAYLIGSGLAALAAACYLVRDGQMAGERIHILEKDPIPGGACDGYQYTDIGYVMRGGREMDNHFECMWDLFRSIPSIETEGVSVLDEYYWLNKADPNYSLCRATEKQGQDAHTDKKFGLSDKGAMEIMKLFFTPDEELYNKRIDEIFDHEVRDSNFWLYWRTRFAFENWHSALEMKLYLKRFIHHVGGLPDFTALRFTRYNQYESMILPMVHYLQEHGVDFQYNTKVVNVEFDIRNGRKAARRIVLQREGRKDAIDLTDNDLVFITNGGCVENSAYGSQNEPAAFNKTICEGGGWDMWRKIAAQDPSFGRSTAGSCRILKRSASATRSPARSLRAASSRPAIPAGFSAGRSIASRSSAISRRTSSSSGSTACSPTSRATSLRRPCASAPARRSAWSGCITLACRSLRSRISQSIAQRPSLL